MKSEKFYVLFYEVFTIESDQNWTWFNPVEQIFSGKVSHSRDFGKTFRLSAIRCPLLSGDFLVSGSRNLFLRFRWQYGCRVLVARRRIPNQRDSIRRITHVRTRAYAIHQLPSRSASSFLPFPLASFFPSTSPCLFLAPEPTTHWSSSVFYPRPVCVLLSPSRLFLLLLLISFLRSPFSFGSFPHDFPLSIFLCMEYQKREKEKRKRKNGKHNRERKNER